MEGAEGFDPADHHLYPVSVRDVGPLRVRPPGSRAAAASTSARWPPPSTRTRSTATSWPSGSSTSGSSTGRCSVENYSENFHTPFVHPSLIVADWDYPIATAGRHRAGLGPAPPSPQRRRAGAGVGTARANRPGPSVAANQIDDVFIAGIYFTVFPNLLVSTFPRYLSALHLTPLSPTRTRVQAYRFWTAEVPEERRAADLAASQEVAAQDLDICERVQRGLLGRRRHERPALGASTSPACTTCTGSCTAALA